MAVAIPIAALIASVAAGADAAYNAHASDVHAEQNKRDQQSNAAQAEAQITQQNAASQAQQAGAVQLARQRAVAALTAQPNYGGTLGTGSQGAAGSQSFGQKTLTGM